MMLSCAAEESNPVISRDYQLLRRMIDTEENFIEVVALGEDLAMDVIRYTNECKLLGEMLLQKNIFVGCG